MAHFILVHGAGHGAWCWHHVVEQLRAQGHSVHALDLPGGGDDETPLAHVKMQICVNAIGNAIEDAPERPVIVAHGLGGAVVTQTARFYTEQIAEIIYVAAYIPLYGETSVDIVHKLSTDDMPDPEWQEEHVFTADGTAASRNPGTLVRIHYHDCSLDDVCLARQKLRPQALAIASTKCDTTQDELNLVARSYIICTEDRSLASFAQRWMVGRTGINRVFEMRTGHSPFFAAPEMLSAMLDHIAANQGEVRLPAIAV